MAISSTWSTVILGWSLGLDACMDERGDWTGVALAEGAAEEVWFLEDLKKDMVIIVLLIGGWVE